MYYYLLLEKLAVNGNIWAIVVFPSEWYKSKHLKLYKMVEQYSAFATTFILNKLTNLSCYVCKSGGVSDESFTFKISLSLLSEAVNCYYYYYI